MSQKLIWPTCPRPISKTAVSLSLPSLLAIAMNSEFDVDTEVVGGKFFVSLVIVVGWHVVVVVIFPPSASSVENV